MATVYDAMLYGGLALAIIFAGIAVLLFVRLNIPKVIGDLTGSTAKKQIQEIREKGYESVQGAGVSKKDAIKAKGDTTRISARDVSSAETQTGYGKSRRLNAKSAVVESSQEKYRKAISELEAEEATNVLNEDYEEATNVLNEDYEEATNVLNEDYEEATNVLSEDYEAETNVLAENAEDDETDVLHEDFDDDETAVLNSVDYEGETDVLTGNYDDETIDVLSSENEIEDSGYQSIKMKMLYDIVVVHTEERIQGGR